MKSKEYPKKIRVLDVDYPVLYFDSRLEVDKKGKEELAAQWDMETDTMRIHKGERSWRAVCQSLWCTALDIIWKRLSIAFSTQPDRSIIEQLAVGVNSVMFFLPDRGEDKGGELVDEEKEK